MSFQVVFRFAYMFDQIIRNDPRYLMSQELLHKHASECQKGGAMHCRNSYNSYPAGTATNNIKVHLSWVVCLQLHQNPIKLSLNQPLACMNHFTFDP